MSVFDTAAEAGHHGTAAMARNNNNNNSNVDDDNKKKASGDSGDSGADDVVVVEDASQADEVAAATTTTTTADGSSTTYRVYKRRWFGLIQLVLLNLIVSWDWLTFSPVSQHAAAYYSTTESAINWLATGFLFAFLVTAPVTVWLLHRGPKPSIVASALLVLIGNWVRYAGSYGDYDSKSGGGGGGGRFGVVILGQIITGFSQPFVLSAPTRYSDMWFTTKGRVAATALASLANPFGAALGQLVVPLLVTKPGDIPNMVLIVSIISTVCAVPAFFIPSSPPTPPSPSSSTPKAPLRSSARLLFSSLEVWLILGPFSIYVGFFNSVSSLLNQMLLPYGFTSDEAGIAGAVLIAVGLVSAAISSPIIDRCFKKGQALIPAIKIFVPVIALAYLAWVWMPQTRSIPGPYVVMALEGMASFCLVPVALEVLCELSHPLSPEITSVVAWAGGQLLGACFILIQDALKAGGQASPPHNMYNALVFVAVVSCVTMPFPMMLGLFGRRDRLVMRRVESERV